MVGVCYLLVFGPKVFQDVTEVPSVRVPFDVRFVCQFLAVGNDLKSEPLFCGRLLEVLEGFFVANVLYQSVSFYLPAFPVRIDGKAPRPIVERVFHIEEPVPLKVSHTTLASWAAARICCNNP